MGLVKNGGRGHVAAYPANLDLSDFDPKAPPPKTEAFWSIVDANQAPEKSEIADALDKLGNPAVVTVARIRPSPMPSSPSGWPTARTPVRSRDGWKTAAMSACETGMTPGTAYG